MARAHLETATQTLFKMRPSGLGSEIGADYLIFCGEWNIGRIYEIRGGPDHLRWFWALHFPSKPENLRTDNRVATLEAAKAEFEASWKQWKAWASLEEVGQPPPRGSSRSHCRLHVSSSASDVPLMVPCRVGRCRRTENMCTIRFDAQSRTSAHAQRR